MVNPPLNLYNYHTNPEVLFIPSKIKHIIAEYGGLMISNVQINEHNVNADIIVAPFSVNKVNMSWDEANDYCNRLVYGGYNDWYLPSMYELISISENIITNIIAQMHGSYWTSTKTNNRYDVVTFDKRNQYLSQYNNVRPIRRIT
jgi:hypothetical protein